jgi:uncharacterized protein YggE
MDPRSTLDELFGNSGVRIALIGVLAILALFLFAQSVRTVREFGQVDLASTATITVSGTGKATAVANIAQISFTVQEQASTVEAAQDSATKRTNTALAALKKLGIDEKDIKTSGYNVSPQYETRPCLPNGPCTQSMKIIGYQVYQSIEVKVRDTKKTGEVLQVLGTAGVQNISGPNFTVEDDSLVQAEARGKAINDAHQKAELLARQLGVRLGKVVSFSEGGNAYPMFMGGMTKAMSADVASAPAPSIPVGENETNSSVTITYEIR